MSPFAPFQGYIDRGKNYQQFAENSELTDDMAGVLGGKEDRGCLIGVDSKLVKF